MSRATASFAIIVLVLLHGISPAFLEGEGAGQQPQLQYLDLQEYILTNAWQPVKPAVDPEHDRGVSLCQKTDDSLSLLRRYHPPVFSPNVSPLSSHLVYTQTTSSHL
ncbi:MAG: hypothetical protein KF749_04870 [Bacteroidetes bacterium]|nr:hypothetical protein [Bacteroidota bacterium]MCW5895398.1 hypothetical protein [Bacteroidota bacterium]